MLVKAGADIGLKTTNGNTAIEWANALGHTKVAEFLLEVQQERESTYFTDESESEL